MGQARNIKRSKKVKCEECNTQEKCCRLGAWVDLEEAKKILTLGIKGGDFFHRRSIGRRQKHLASYPRVIGQTDFGQGVFQGAGYFHYLSVRIRPPA